MDVKSVKLEESRTRQKHHKEGSYALLTCRENALLRVLLMCRCIQHTMFVAGLAKIFILSSPQSFSENGSWGHTVSFPANIFGLL